MSKRRMTAEEAEELVRDPSRPEAAVGPAFYVEDGRYWHVSVIRVIRDHGIEMPDSFTAHVDDETGEVDFFG